MSNLRRRTTIELLSKNQRRDKYILRDQVKITGQGYLVVMEVVDSMKTSIPSIQEDYYKRVR
jgi:hypothetical protein